MAGLFERGVLMGPHLIARAAIGQAATPEQRWMLNQPRKVRVSYVQEVLDRGETEANQRAWMLRADESVRESYIAEVLGAKARPEVVWMLRQSDSVRESFVRDVVLKKR